jgi:hypothetical protein
VLLVERQSATTLPKIDVREVEVCRERPIDLEWKEEKRVITVLSVKPRQCEELVTCMTSHPETTVDPCTGQCCTVYKQVPVTKKVTITVYDTVPEQKTVIVRVPCLKPGKEMVVKKLVLDETTVPAICKRYELLESNNTVPAPVCPPVCLPH